MSAIDSAELSEVRFSELNTNETPGDAGGCNRGDEGGDVASIDEDGSDGNVAVFSVGRGGGSVAGKYKFGLVGVGGGGEGGRGKGGGGVYNGEAGDWLCNCLGMDGGNAGFFASV